MVKLFERSADGFLKASIKQMSFSLTLGVFLGAALTTGAACGIAAFWLANEKVVRRLRGHALQIVSSARDAALGTREGQALSRALLAAPGAAPVAAPAASAAPCVPATPAPTNARDFATFDALVAEAGVSAESRAALEKEGLDDPALLADTYRREGAAGLRSLLTGPRMLKAGPAQKIVNAIAGAGM